jgi:DinB superfamily
MKAITSLHKLIDHVPERLAKLPIEGVENRPSPSKWSAKEELGHLLDSAANNHQRIVRAQLENNLAMPGYAQNAWVAVNRYQARDWNELIDLWQALNRQLLAAAVSAPDLAWSHTLTVANSAPMTLEFIFEDYLTHMAHHLEHIGIEVRDALDSPAAAQA